jgi:hypothetical protein
MRLNPIRRSQLVAPFGPGAIHVLEGGVAVVTGGLDDWFKDRNGNSVDPQEISKGPLVVREPRLEIPLRVSHFRVAPGPENRGDSNDPELVTPVFRFPTWYFCPRCQRMKESKLSQPGHLTCDKNECKKSRLRQVSFAAVCDHGHLQDFPWLEWVHRGVGPFHACANKLVYSSEGSGSLDSIRIKCEQCNISRSMAGVMSGEFPKNSGDKGWSGLTRDLLSKPGESKSSDDSAEFNCQGCKPWQGSVLRQPCSRPLRVVLINATNVHYADVRSAIFIPPRYRPSASRLLTILDETDFRNRIGMWRRADDEIEDIVKKLRKLDASNGIKRLGEYSDSEIESALLGHVEAPLSGSEASSEPPQGSRGEQEEQIKRDEFEAFLGETDREGELVLRSLDATILPPELDGWIDKIVAIEKLRETRVFAGFSRLMGRPPKGAPTSVQLLWRDYPKDLKNRWLPAAVVRGEGIFLRFSEKKIKEWENRPEVQAHLAPLQQNHDACVLRYNWEERVIEPRFVLLHTLAHLLINRLVFECGYGSASLRERLYVSSEEGKEMAGILIYTAAGDSEGTMGGLVRLADPESLGRILVNAVEEAQWCSADPVCGEAASSGGQGPDSLNLAACHSCALLPETSCEHFNKFLDRMVVVNPKISIFSNL